MKAVRHRRILKILRERPVTSQAELADLLRSAGQPVTQATLSRDLEELGAFKARLADGQVAYRIPEEPPGNGHHLVKMLNEFVVSIEASANMIVLRTPPGCAQPVARAIDTAPVRDVIGTLAGDDTVLCITREKVAGRTVAKRLEAMIDPSKTSKEASP